MSANIEKSVSKAVLTVFVPSLPGVPASLEVVVTDESRAEIYTSRSI